MSSHKELFDRLTLILHDQPVNVTGYIDGYIRMKFPKEIITTSNLVDLLAEFNTVFIDDGLVLSDIGVRER